MSDVTQLHRREAEFHDQWAGDTDLSRVDVRAAFEGPTALENRFIINMLGPLAGRRVLDVGAGLGESSVYFALAGAHVTSTDMSPGMCAAVSTLAKFNGVQVETRACPAEDLDAPSGAFDIVYIANTLHHVPDKDAVFSQIRRVLRPGGTFVSIDPLTYNPIIAVYRRMADKVRTADEAPLGIDDVRLARRYFPDLQHREFWVTSLALMLKYYFVDRVHPNADRYWKRILREDESNLRWWLPLRSFDERLTRIPGIRWLAWNTVLWGTRPS